MKTHLAKTVTLGSGIALGTVMLALNPSTSLAAQTHHRHHAHQSFVQPLSSGYGFVSGPAYSPGPAYRGDLNVNRDNSVDRP
jgi:hypothetical protein